MITNKLKKASLKSTFQREKILEYIISRKEHPTADMIYKYMLTLSPCISKTTVYNTVKSLTKTNIIKSIKFLGKDEIRYDGTVDTHHHFLCEKCGKIYDIEVQCQNFNKKEINGHKIHNAYAYFTGICKECKK
ncbi:MAG: Fur family transcriptional regulator [Endomicrobiaceae bacterium]